MTAIADKQHPRQGKDINALKRSLHTYKNVVDGCVGKKAHVVLYMQKKSLEVFFASIGLCKIPLFFTWKDIKAPLMVVVIMSTESK